MRVTAKAALLAEAFVLAANSFDAQTKKIRSLGMIRLRIDNGGLTVVSNVSDLCFSTYVPADVENAGEIAVDGEKLAALVSTLSKDGSLRLSADDGGTLIITHGRGRWRLPDCPLRDLPAPLAVTEEIGAFTADSATMTQLLTPAFAAGHEDSRFHLCGLLIHQHSDLVVSVATDGTELARRTIPASGSLGDGRDLIIPNKTLVVLTKILKQIRPKQVTLRRARKLVSFGGERFSLTSKLIDAEFPHYEAVVPAPSSNTAELDRRALIGALNRLGAIESETKYPVFTLRWAENTEGLNIAVAKDPDAGEETIEAKTSGQAYAGMATLRLVKLLDQLDAERICLDLNGPHSALKIASIGDEGLTVLMMPTRLSTQAETAAKAPAPAVVKR